MELYQYLPNVVLALIFIVILVSLLNLVKVFEQTDYMSNTLLATYSLVLVSHIWLLLLLAGIFTNFFQN